MNKYHLIPVITLVVLAGAILLPGHSEAKGKTMNTYSKEYAIGYTEGFWSAREPKTYKSSRYDGCKPGNVKISYYYSKNKNQTIERIARAKVGYAKKKYSSKPGYCTIQFNKHALETATEKTICVAFVHEYGHLLGYTHSLDKKSVMFKALDPHNEALSGPYPCNP
jgi:Matrixin